MTRACRAQLAFGQGQQQRALGLEQAGELVNQEGLAGAGKALHRHRLIDTTEEFAQQAVLLVAEHQVAGQGRQVHRVQRGCPLAVAVGELEIPLALGVQQLLGLVLHLGRQQCDPVFAQHAQAHGEGFAIEVLCYLPLEAPRRGAFDLVGNAHDFGKAAFLRIRRGGGGLARQVLHEQHDGGVEHAGGGEEVGGGLAGEAVGLVAGQRQVEHRHLG